MHAMLNYAYAACRSKKKLYNLIFPASFTLSNSAAHASRCKRQLDGIPQN